MKRLVLALALSVAPFQASGPAAQPPPAEAALPKLEIPDVRVDPSADAAYVTLRLSAPPTTTALVEVATINGDDPDPAKRATEGSQFERVTRLVVFEAGGPPVQTVTIPLKRGAGRPGQWFGLYALNAENPGLQPGGVRGRILFEAGARNAPQAAARPAPRTPAKGALVYSLDLGSFRASPEGGRGVWRTAFSHGRTQDSNQELGYYADAGLHPGTRPFEVRDGVLVLRAQQLARPLRANVRGEQRSFDYAASVLQAAWIAQQYGYFEVEAKSRSARGTWAAFWLLPSDGSWPPEIDVFEHPRNGQVGPADTTVAMHWGTPEQHKKVGAEIPLDRLWGRAVDLTAGYHAYAVDWRADYTTWYVDGRPVWTTPTRFHKPAFPVLDVAVGGWGGPPDFRTGTTEMLVRSLKIWR